MFEADESNRVDYIRQMLVVRSGVARIMITHLIIISGEIPKKIVH